MIGQSNLLNLINSQIDKETLSRFILLVGPKGSQKQDLATHIATQLKSTTCIVDDISVDTIRNIVTESYTVKTPTIFIILNADKMSAAAKNALLKVTEEPPNKSRFIITLEDINNTLPTVRSRGTVYQMENLTAAELSEYYCKKYNKVNIDFTQSEVLHIAETLYEIDLLVKYDIYEFISYIHKVIENIAVVSGANSFKIADRINFKDSDDKYDLKLFWKGFMRICATNLLNDVPYYSAGIKITSAALSKLNVTGINKQMLFDKWLLDIRSAWME